MNVSAIIVTRGNVDLQPVLDSLPKEWEQIVWHNGSGSCSVRYVGEERPNYWNRMIPVDNLSVYGRYAAIEYASHDLIYVQDDDVIVSDPQAIVQAWSDVVAYDGVEGRVADPRGFLVANMPQEFRHEGYTDSCLVGFGACFHGDLPEQCFERYTDYCGSNAVTVRQAEQYGETFHRTCDVVFTTLTPRVLVDVPKTDREFASDPDRMWKQKSHFGERVRMLDLARMVRDA